MIDVLETAAWLITTANRTECVAKAMAEAALAVRAPYVEVRFVCRRAEDCVVALESFVRLLADDVDMPATLAHGEAMIVEFKNGSCISILFEGKRPC